MASWNLALLCSAFALIILQCQFISSSSSSSSVTELYHTYQDIEEKALKMSADPIITKEGADLVRLYHLINIGKDKYEMALSNKLRDEYAKLMASGRNSEFVMYYKLNDDMAVGREMLMLFTNQVVAQTTRLSLDQPAGASKLKINHICSIVANKPHLVCVVSFKSMYETVVSMMGPNVTLLATPPGIPQFYRVTDDVKVFRSEFSRVTVCHKQMFDEFAVYTCHLIARTEVHLVPLVGVENGVELQAVSICHKDTSAWNTKFHAFVLLHVKPGTPVCHFLSTDDLVWVNDYNVEEEEEERTSM